MSAQRSVWSPPPAVAQKYATYFGGFIDGPWYGGEPLIRLWWTDEELGRLAYRELALPGGLLELFNGVASQLPRGFPFSPPRLSSVTHDNTILFLDILDLRSAISALYVVCDAESVLRYGLVDLPLPPNAYPSYRSLTIDAGSWTWDGEKVWPMFLSERQVGVDLFSCQLDTTAGSAGQLTQVFDGYYNIITGGLEPSFELYYCQSAGWVSTDPRSPYSVLANILYIFQYPDTSTPGTGDYLVDWTAQSKYLPDGPVPVFISRSGVRGRHILHGRSMYGTFPVGPAALVMFDPDNSVEDDRTLDIVINDRVGVRIPVIRSQSPHSPYYQTSSTGLPYDLTGGLGSHWLLRCSGNRAAVYFNFMRLLTSGSPIDVLIEFDLQSGMAVRDLVVPAIWPPWGMEHEGDVLAVPYRTSSKGRLKLP